MTSGELNDVGAGDMKEASWSQSASTMKEFLLDISFLIFRRHHSFVLEFAAEMHVSTWSLAIRSTLLSAPPHFYHNLLHFIIF